jgi:hypothetical protein
MKWSLNKFSRKTDGILIERSIPIIHPKIDTLKYSNVLLFLKKNENDKKRRAKTPQK